MKIQIPTLVFAICCAAAGQQAAKPAATPVEMTAEPSHHLKIDNEYVRAFYVEIAPGQTTLQHRHANDYVAIAFGPAEVDSTTADGQVKHLDFGEGQVRFSPAGLVHTATNRGTTTFRNATIELLQNQGHPVCVNDCENDPRAKGWPPLPPTAKVIGYGDTFRIALVTVKPQQAIPTDDPYPHMAIFLTDTQIDSGPGAVGGLVKHSAYEMAFHKPHPDLNVKNTGQQDVRIIAIQFKPVTK